MTDFVKGGRGKKAPYNSEMRRIPSPLKEVVERLSATYKQWVAEYDDPEDHELLTRVQLRSQNGISEIYEEHQKQLQELKKENAQLERLAKERQSLIQELANCREEITRLRSQSVPLKAVDPSAAIALLQNAIAPKTSGGSYAANNATGLKKRVEQALALLTGSEP